MSIAIDLSGRTALVTGSSQGIGAEIARLLHAAGARVVINHPDVAGGPVHQDAHALRKELTAARADSAIVIAADVSDPAAVASMVREIAQQWQHLDILVNNAGILRDRSVGKMTLDEWRSVLEVDLSGVFYCCKFGLEIMNDGGSIVSIGSLAAKMGFHGQANYAAAKAGAQALTRVLARECARRSIRVNAVAPGVIDTAIAAGFSEATRAQLSQSIAMRRLGQPREVAQAVLFLSSTLASYITGHVLEVDGGYLG